MPQGAHGVSAHDMTCGYALTVPSDSMLAPFMVPSGLPETEIAVRLFANFRELYALFTRVNREESFRQQMRLNKNRFDRVFEPGEIVFRRLPSAARLPKHLFPEPSSGPYEVAGQPTSTSVVLRHPDGGDLVDKGMRVPLDQILAGPPRAKIVFEGASEVRGLALCSEKRAPSQDVLPLELAAQRAGERVGVH